MTSHSCTRNSNPVNIFSEDRMLMKSSKRTVKPMGGEGKRDYSIDLAKAILIFLVVWGHMIQYLHGTDYNFWEDPLFKAIYGFHMPLFAWISGYLMYGSFQRYEVKKLIKRRAEQLITPTIGWAAALTVVDVALNLFTHENSSLSWIVGRLISRLINDLWFLKAMFIACIIVILLEKCFHGFWIAYIICSFLTLLSPKVCNIDLYGFVLPFFLLGFKIGEIAKKWNEKLSKNKRAGVLAVSLIAYIFLLQFFHKDNYIYTTGLGVINSEKGFFSQIMIDIYRVVVALVGCLMVLEGCSLITKCRNFVTTVSSKTMIIYIITTSTYIPQLIGRVGVKIVRWPISAVIMNIIVLIPISIVMICFALMAEIVIKKIKLGKVLLGR